MPRDHLLRKIEKAVDFQEVYGMVEQYYCADNGRPAADPAVLVKIVLIQHLFGIASLRQTLREVEVNLAYRWFLGLDLTTKPSHFETVSWK